MMIITTYWCDLTNYYNCFAIPGSPGKNNDSNEKENLWLVWARLMNNRNAGLGKKTIA